jgi:hypothetical protein
MADRVVGILDMPAPDSGNGRFPHGVTELDSDLRPACWSSNSVELELNGGCFISRVG